MLLRCVNSEWAVVCCRLVEDHGQGAWSAIARALNQLMSKPDHAGRIGKQCRER